MLTHRGPQLGTSTEVPHEQQDTRIDLLSHPTSKVQEYFCDMRYKNISAPKMDIRALLNIAPRWTRHAQLGSSDRVNQYKHLISLCIHAVIVREERVEWIILPSLLFSMGFVLIPCQI